MKRNFVSCETIESVDEGATNITHGAGHGRSVALTRTRGFVFVALARIECIEPFVSSIFEFYNFRFIEF